jgi:hypothetical protein
MGKASNLFNGTAEQTLINRITPTSEQREFLQGQWNGLAERLTESLQNHHGYQVSTLLQGSYKYGTLIKPVHKDEEYDVDVGLYFRWRGNPGGTPTALVLRTWTQEALQQYARTNTDVRRLEEPPKERCSRVVYGRQFHIDTPVYHLDPDTDRRRLACLSGRWEDSDPKSLYQWFKNAVGAENREQLRRLVRYLKGWAAVAFNDAADARPTSVVLTVLCAEAFQRRLAGGAPELEDDDALALVVREIVGRIRGDRAVENPVDKTEDLNRVPAEYWGTSLGIFEAFNETASEALEAGDEAGAALAWSEAFSFLMPLPEADQVEVFEEGAGQAIATVPDINISVFARAPRRFLNNYRNEVPSVPKGCDLEFSVANPGVIPDYASVEWTVRNEGIEADVIGDLGHRRVGIRLLEAKEQTSYAGRHYMDCVVRLNGHVYGVRRVPVVVRDAKYPPRNVPKPAYAKLRTLMRRR